MFGKPKNWPAAPARHGESYQVEDPVFKKDKLAVMLLSTWLECGTKFEVLTRKVAAAERAAIELKVTNDVLTKQLADLQAKHTNLREAVRAERTAKANNQLKVL